MPAHDPGRGDHLEVEVGPLLEPLRLEQLALGVHLLEPLGQFVADRLRRLLERRSRRDIVRVGVDLDAGQVGDLLPGQRVELGDRLDLIAEEAQPPRRILIVRREQLERIAADAEVAAGEAGVVALVLERDELADDLLPVGGHALLEGEGHRAVRLDRADAVQARHRGDDDDVVAFEQRPRRRMAHPVDRLVHRRFFLDVRIRPRDIGLGLVIVVVADEILDGIVGEEALELAVQLRREDLVRGEDERRALNRLDDLGGGEGLARSGDAEQHLVAVAGVGLRHQLGDRRRLVARRHVIGDQPERLAAFGFLGPRRAVRDERAGRFRVRRARCGSGWRPSDQYGPRSRFVPVPQRVAIGWANGREPGRASRRGVRAPCGAAIAATVLTDRGPGSAPGATRGGAAKRRPGRIRAAAFPPRRCRCGRRYDQCRRGARWRT